jgi:hypothetical protein
MTASVETSRDDWEHMLSGEPPRQVIDANNPYLLIPTIPPPPTKLKAILENIKTIRRKKRDAIVFLADHTFR